MRIRAEVCVKLYRESDAVGVAFLSVRVDIYLKEWYNSVEGINSRHKENKIMLKSGFARLDITPPFGTPLAGYYEARYLDGVRDPLYTNALALNDGERTLVIITADVLMISMDASAEIRKMISERVDIPADCIMINSLHQHTSIRVGSKRPGVTTDPIYLDILYRKFCDVAQMAIDDLADCTFGTAIHHATEDISFIRRYIGKDGKLYSNPFRMTPDQLEGPAAKSDNDVRLILFKREGVKDIALVNFATHPDVIGRTKASADWPGFVRRFVEADHEDTHCIFMNGFQGDTNHYNFMIDEELRGVGYKQSQKMGRVIADTVNLMWDKTEERENYKLSSEIRCIFNKCSTRGEEHYEECKAFMDRYRAGDYSSTVTESGILLPEAGRIAAIPEQPVYHKIPITVMGMGDVVFFGLGGEPFTEYGHIAREAFPEKFMLTATCANGGEGYLPSKQAFSQGGYEVISSHFTDSLQKTVLDTSFEMIKNI